MSDASITIGNPKTDTVQRALDNVAAKAMKLVIVPAVKEAAELIAHGIEIRAPQGTGTMRQAVGVTGMKLYGDGTVAWEGAGVRRGFGRMIAVVEANNDQGYKLKRLSKKASAKAEGKGFFFSDPSKIAHIIEGGRKAVSPMKGKALFDPRTGKFFKSSPAVTGTKFIEQANQSGIAQAGLKIAINNFGKLFDSALKE